MDDGQEVMDYINRTPLRKDLLINWFLIKKIKMGQQTSQVIPKLTTQDVISEVWCAPLGVIVLCISFLPLKILRILNEHLNPVTSIKVLPGSNNIVSGSADNTLKIWNIESGECLETLKMHFGAIRSIFVLSDNNKIISTSDDSSLRIWTINKQHFDNQNTWNAYIFPSFFSNNSQSLRLVGHTRPVLTLGLIRFTDDSSNSNDNIMIVSGSDDHTMRIWNIDNGNCQAVLRGHKDSVKCLVIKNHINSSMIVSGSSDKNLKIWNIKWNTNTITDTNTTDTTGTDTTDLLKLNSNFYNIQDLIMNTSYSDYEDDNVLEASYTLSGHKDEIMCLCLCHHDRVCSGSYDNNIKLWDIKNQSCIETMIGHKGAISSLIGLSNDRICSSSHDKTLRIWSLLDYTCLTILTGHEGWINTINILSNHRIISGSEDNTIRIWDDKSGDCLEILIGHTGWVWCIQQLKNECFVSGSDDRNIIVWGV